MKIWFDVFSSYCFLNIGIGFGSFQSVDFALVMDVLPEEKDKAKDLAVWHLALILPNALATPVGGLILDYFESVNCRIGLGYIILFIVTTVYFLLSGIFVTRIRQAKWLQNGTSLNRQCALFATNCYIFNLYFYLSFFFEIKL